MLAGKQVYCSIHVVVNPAGETLIDMLPVLIQLYIVSTFCCRQTSALLPTGGGKLWKGNIDILGACPAAASHCVRLVLQATNLTGAYRWC